MEIKFGKWAPVIGQISPEDYDKVMKYSWWPMRLKDHTYLRTIDPETGKQIFLHRYIMDVLDDKSVVIDHKDGDGTNNQRENLRICSFAQNMRNLKIKGSGKSKYKGVTKVANGWQARIHGENLGWWLDEITAAEAYNKRALEIDPEYFSLNIIDGYTEGKEPEIKKREKSSSLYRGVIFNKLLGKFVARITVDRVLYLLGNFETQEEAAWHYNKYIVDNGLTRLQNILPEGYTPNFPLDRGCL